MTDYAPGQDNADIPEVGWDWEPIQCAKVADVEYGRELRCALEAGHEGACEA